MKDVVVKYTAEMIYGLIVAGFALAYNNLCKRVQRQVADQRALKEGTLALLRSEIIRNYDRYIGQGWIPIYAMENVCSLYNAYHELGATAR